MERSKRISGIKGVILSGTAFAVLAEPSCSFPKRDDSPPPPRPTPTVDLTPVICKERDIQKCIPTILPSRAPTGSRR